MALRATRSASRAARIAEAVATGPFGALSHDELGVIVDGLADPLQPVVAVALSSTCLGLRTPLRAALEVLKERHSRAKELCRKMHMSCERTRTTDHWSFYSMRVTAADMATLGMVMCWLPALQELYLSERGLGDAGLVALCDALAQGAAPSLTDVYLSSNKIGPAGAEALAAALSRGALPNLKMLCLHGNPLGSPGVAALAVPLRTHPCLNFLSLYECRIGDKGLASLVGNLGKDDFKALGLLDLDTNELTDESCTTIVAALDNGAMPEINQLLMLEGHALSEKATDAFRASAGRRGITIVDEVYEGNSTQGFAEDMAADQIGGMDMAEDQNGGMDEVSEGDSTQPGM